MTMDSTHQQSQRAGLRQGSGAGGKFRRAILRRIVSQIVHGRFAIVTPEGETIEHTGALPGPDATWVLHNWKPVMRLVTRGDLGFAESYMDGDWSSPDLPALISICDHNYQALLRYIEGFAPLRLFNKWRHKLRANTRSGSRRNIEAHYDLGNDFYKLWLDPTMTYSSAIFARGHETLEQAQLDKIGRIVELLDVAGGQRVLEIGCGWGALSRAIVQAGAGHVTGLTLSPSQRKIALETAQAAGTDAATDIRLEDYRDVKGEFDRIVSIEMIEAVGEQYWPAYFGAIHDRLKPGGHAIVQAITISEARYEGYRTSVDFIQRYIFPGGMLPAQEIIAAQAARAGLTFKCEETFRLGYARTLAIWRQRFLAVWPAIAAQGFDDRFRRMWEYYLAYCESGFRNGTVDVGLYRLTREG